MFEVNCQSCGGKASVQSFLAAAQKACPHCGQFLMGALEQGTRTVRPAGFEQSPAAPPVAYAPSSPARLWLSVIAGGLTGLAGVGVIAYAGQTIPVHVRGALLGALSGVLWAPVVAISLFLFMIIPFVNLGLAGVLGDCTWTSVSRALCERKLRHLILPFIVFLVLPMAICGFGGSKFKTITNPALVTAALGAAALGAVVGGIGSRFAGKARQGD
jgi:hypothetical protein